MSAVKVMGVILGKAWRILSAIASPLLKDKENVKAARVCRPDHGSVQNIDRPIGTGHQ